MGYVLALCYLMSNDECFFMAWQTTSRSQLVNDIYDFQWFIDNAGFKCILGGVIFLNFLCRHITNADWQISCNGWLLSPTQAGAYFLNNYYVI